MIAVLTEKTEAGALDWEDELHLQVSASIDLSKISLWSGNDERTDEPFVAFGLFNNNNKLLDSWFVDESDPDYLLVFRLFRAAQRHANGVPNLLRDLTEKLSSLTKIVE